MIDNQESSLDELIAGAQNGIDRIAEVTPYKRKRLLGAFATVNALADEAISTGLIDSQQRTEILFEAANRTLAVAEAKNDRVTPLLMTTIMSYSEGLLELVSEPEEMINAEEIETEFTETANIEAVGKVPARLRAKHKKALLEEFTPGPGNDNEENVEDKKMRLEDRARFAYLDRVQAETEQLIQTAYEKCRSVFGCGDEDLLGVKNMKPDVDRGNVEFELFGLNFTVGTRTVTQESSGTNVGIDGIHDEEVVTLYVCVNGHQCKLESLADLGKYLRDVKEVAVVSYPTEAVIDQPAAKKKTKLKKLKTKKTTRPSSKKANK